MLAEAVVAEEHSSTAVVIREHGVGPVEHGSLDEGEPFIPAQFQDIACLDIHEVPVFMVVAAQDGLAFCRAVNGSVGDFAHELRESAGMVGLVVLHYDCIYLVQRDFLLQAGYEFLVVRTPYGVEQNCLLEAPHEICIIAGAALCAEFVSVEHGELPVHLSNPGYVIGYFL